MKKKYRVSIVYDEFGRILSITRLAEGVKAIILSGKSQSVLTSEIDEESIGYLISGYRVDISQNALVKLNTKTAL